MQRHEPKYAVAEHSRNAMVSAYTDRTQEFLRLTFALVSRAAFRSAVRTLDYKASRLHTINPLNVTFAIK